MWESVLRFVGGEGRGMEGLGESKERWGVVKKCGGMCGRVYGVSVEGVRKCVGVWKSYGWGG